MEIRCAYAEKSSGGYTPRWKSIVLMPYSKNSVTSCVVLLAYCFSLKMFNAVLLLSL
jgi:hypothetical protein